MLLAGAKFALIWCFFFQHGAPGWCKMCPHLAFFPSRWCSWLVHNFVLIWRVFFKIMLMAAALIWRVFFKMVLLAGAQCAHLILFFFKMVLLARLLAGATCVLIWCFPSKWCSWLVQNLLMLPQQRSR